ncbi:MAG: ribbon-helix-helix protein, CopG family [Candidatus Micrarchaeaceae archaeon]
MVYLHFTMRISLLNKVNEEASRLNVKRTLLMKAAIQAFIENPPETIQPLPTPIGGFRQKETTQILLTLPKDTLEKIRSYAAAKGLSVRKVAEKAIADFLNLSDEQKLIYINKEMERLAENRKGKPDKEYTWQLLESIASKEPYRLVETSFNCVDDLHKLLEKEARERGTIASELVRRAIEEFLRKYGDNSEEITKLYEVAKDLHYSKAGDKVCALRVPAYMTVQLAKIADKVNVSKSALIRLAIVKYLNLVDTELQKHIELQKQIEPQKPIIFMCAASLVSMLEEEAKKANTRKAAIVRKAVTQLLQHSVDEISELSKKTSPYSGSYVVLIKLPESLVAQLDAIAEKISTSRSNLMRTALAAYFRLV